MKNERIPDQDLFKAAVITRLRHVHGMSSVRDVFAAMKRHAAVNGPCWRLGKTAERVADEMAGVAS